MIAYAHLEATIADVEEITLEPLQADETVPVYQRCISVRTAEGETFQLVLRATKKHNLGFHKVHPSGWLRPIPIIYKLSCNTK